MKKINRISLCIIMSVVLGKTYAWPRTENNRSSDAGWSSWFKNTIDIAPDGIRNTLKQIADVVYEIIAGEKKSNNAALKKALHHKDPKNRENEEFIIIDADIDNNDDFILIRDNDISDDTITDKPILYNPFTYNEGELSPSQLQAQKAQWIKEIEAVAQKTLAEQEAMKKIGLEIKEAIEKTKKEIEEKEKNQLTKWQIACDKAAEEKYEQERMRSAMAIGDAIGEEL